MRGFDHGLTLATITIDCKPSQKIHSFSGQVLHLLLRTVSLFASFVHVISILVYFGRTSLQRPNSSCSVGQRSGRLRRWSHDDEDPHQPRVVVLFQCSGALRSLPASVPGHVLIHKCIKFSRKPRPPQEATLGVPEVTSL